ncbi:hypothetical protein CXU15_04625 [Akkermansia muciniphila]|nr:hypothetical protein CXU15_04625 [Akkermansia muciniphila]
MDVDDNAPADYLDIVIPADEGGTITVISESPAWVDDAVEKSLQERGMYVTPVDGETVLTMSAGTSTRDFNYFTFALNSTYISGHLAGSYRLNKIALQTPASEANGTRWMARLCRYSAGLALPLEVLGTSTSTASWTSINASTMECHWNFDGIAVSAADRLILEVYAVDSSGTTVSKALIAYGAAASHGGTEGVLIASGDKLAWRNYSRLALSMSVAYDAGVSVGGIELASRRHFDALSANVEETGKQIADDADAAQQAREEAEQIASGMTLTTGTITTGVPGSQATAELKPGSTAGSYTLDMTIPRGDVGTVDTSQAYTWTQPQTYDAMINANGGINIPLAAGAPMDMMAVNRLYAAGMAGVTNIYTQRTYLDTGSITATGAAASTAIIPGQYAKTVIPANTHSTVVHNFIGPVGQWNYSSFAGLSVPWQLSAAGKFAIGIGRGNKTVRKDLTLDSYSIIPGNDLAYNTGEILDITFTNVRDTTRSGYEIRVREIYCTESTQRWKVKTTTSFIPASGNEPIPYIVNKIIYQQYAPRSYIAGDYGDAYGALYLLTGGGSNQQLWKIATVRGVTTFETGPGFSSIVSDVLGVSGGSVGLFVGTAERTNYQPGNVNPVYYALEAITNNAIETEETTDFEDINVPIG